MSGDGLTDGQRAARGVRDALTVLTAMRPMSTDPNDTVLLEYIVPELQADPLRALTALTGVVTLVHRLFVDDPDGYEKAFILWREIAEIAEGESS